MPLNLSKNQIIIIGSAALIIVFFVLVFSGLLPGRRNDVIQPERVRLTMWGVFDDPGIWRDIINSYEAQNQNVDIQYESVNPNEYEAGFINALAAGEGPDILMVHNTWMPKHGDKLIPVNEDVLTTTTLRQLYPQVIENDFAVNGKILALPLALDTLALFYNQDIFNDKQIVFPPETWDDFAAVSARLREFGSGGKLIQAGAAMGGTSKSIKQAPDIVTLLMMQNGVAMVDSNFNRARINNDSAVSALEFYAQFSDPRSSQYTWTDSLGSAVDEFAEGNVGMMINYSYQIPNIQTKNSSLNFSIAPVPQPKDATQSVNFADYWGLAVPSGSSEVEQKWSWDFITFATTNQAVATKYGKETGRPSALRFLINQSLNDSVLGTFATQTLTARNWYQKDNNKIEEILSSMIESTVTKSLSAKEALRRAEEQITTLLNQ